MVHSQPGKEPEMHQACPSHPTCDCLDYCGRRSVAPRSEIPRCRPGAVLKRIPLVAVALLEPLYPRSKALAVPPSPRALQKGNPTVSNLPDCPVLLLSITGKTFRANNIAFAEYDELKDAWQGMVRPVSWTALRVLSAAVATDLVGDARTVFNPWNERPEVIPVVQPAAGRPRAFCSRAKRPSEASGRGPTGITPSKSARRE